MQCIQTPVLLVRLQPELKMGVLLKKSSRTYVCVCVCVPVSVCTMNSELTAQQAQQANDEAAIRRSRLITPWVAMLRKTLHLKLPLFRYHELYAVTNQYVYSGEPIDTYVRIEQNDLGHTLIAHVQLPPPPVPASVEFTVKN